MFLMFHTLFLFYHRDINMRTVHCGPPAGSPAICHTRSHATHPPPRRLTLRGLTCRHTPKTHPTRISATGATHLLCYTYTVYDTVCDSLLAASLRPTFVGCIPDCVMTRSSTTTVISRSFTRYQMQVYVGYTLYTLTRFALKALAASDSPKSDSPKTR